MTTTCGAGCQGPAAEAVAELAGVWQLLMGAAWRLAPCPGTNTQLQHVAQAARGWRRRRWRNWQAAGSCSWAPRGDWLSVVARRMTTICGAGCQGPAAEAAAELAGGGQLLIGAAWQAAGAPDLAAAAAAIRIACYGGPHCGGGDNAVGARVGGAAAEGGGGSRQEEADIALAYAQLAVIAYERQGPRYVAIFVPPRLYGIRFSRLCWG